MSRRVTSGKAQHMAYEDDADSPTTEAEDFEGSEPEGSEEEGEGEETEERGETETEG